MSIKVIIFTKSMSKFNGIISQNKSVLKIKITCQIIVLAIKIIFSATDYTDCSYTLPGQAE